MSYELPTVAVDMDGQMVFINAKDFDASIHKAWDDAQEEEQAEDEEQAEEPESQPAPKQRGRRASN